MAASHSQRLSSFFCVRDYSWHDAKQINGLDEFVEIVVNGKVHRMATNSGLPAAVEAKPIEQWMSWYDLEIPKSELVRGRNEIVFRLAPPPGKAPDDYLYLGIDNTVHSGNSGTIRLFRPVELPKRQFHRGQGGVPGAIVPAPRRSPVRGGLPPGGEQNGRSGEHSQYAGTEGLTGRLEWDLPVWIVPPWEITVQAAEAKSFEFSWLDEEGKPVKPAIKARGPRHRVTVLPLSKVVPAGLEFPRASRLGP